MFHRILLQYCIIKVAAWAWQNFCPAKIQLYGIPSHYNVLFSTAIRASLWLGADRAHTSRKTEGRATILYQVLFSCGMTVLWIPILVHTYNNVHEATGLTIAAAAKNSLFFNS